MFEEGRMFLQGQRMQQFKIHLTGIPVAILFDKSCCSSLDRFNLVYLILPVFSRGKF